MYLDNNRELQSEFGPRVHEGPIRRRNAARHSYLSRDGNGRRVETNLIAHLGSHSDAITGIAVSPDHMFFVSSSDDKTVKIWDTARLERNVTSKARHTYNQHHSKVKAVCVIEGTHCFASAAEDGSVHVVRVHVSTNQGAGGGGGLPKYGRVQVIREHRLEIPGEYVTCIIHYSTRKLCVYPLLPKSNTYLATSSNLLYATTHATITTLDLRTMRILQTMQNPRHYGPITSLCVDRKRTWCICGTATGVLSLWDLRFGILIKSWSVGASTGGHATKIHQVSVHPTKGKGRWIIVALGTFQSTKDQDSTASPKFTPLIEVWDIEKSTLVETYVTRTVPSASQPIEEVPGEVKAREAESSPAAAIAALVRARQETQETPPPLVARRRSSSQKVPTIADGISSQSNDVVTFAIGAEFGGHGTVHRSAMADRDDFGSARTSGGRGFMICGSEDRKIRLWDLGRVERSIVLSTPDEEGDKPTYRYARSSPNVTCEHMLTFPTK